MGDKTCPYRDQQSLFTVPHRTNLEYELSPEWLGGQSSRKVISVSSLYNMTPSSQCGHRITLYSKQNQMQSVSRLLCNPVTTINVGNGCFFFQVFNLISWQSCIQGQNQPTKPTLRHQSVAVSDTCDTYTFEHILGLQKCKMLKCVSGTVFILCLLQTHIAHPSVKGLYFR